MTQKGIWKQKKQSKLELAERLELNKKRPILGIFIDKELNKKSLKVLKEILKGLEQMKVEVVVLTDSIEKDLPMKHVKILPYNRENRQLLLEGADMSLGFKFSDVEEMLLHGTIPISPVRPEVSDYNPNHETGNAFIYMKEDPWVIFAALVRALETFKFRYDWNHIVRQGMESVGKEVEEENQEIA